MDTNELASWAKENGILVSPGRAGSAGWLLNWLLGITEPNPIDYHLLSERFYNKDSARIPDIDMEVENSEIYGTVLIDVVEDPALSQIKQCLALIQDCYGLSIDIHQIPLDDVETMNRFRTGETEGVAQFDSQEMKTWLTALKPDCFEDIAALYAISRPGMTEIVSEFILRKHNESATYENEIIRSILGNSYGIIVYQEQIMSILKDIAGFSPEEADLARTLFQKKCIDKLKEYHLKFINQGLQKGCSATELENIWEMMEFNGNKVFCRAHAICRCLTAYRMAYLKAHWPKVCEVPKMRAKEKPQKRF